jgi:ABC-type amino acid transport substrate-binding protein
MKEILILIQAAIITLLFAAHVTAGNIAPDIEKIFKKGKITVAMYYEDTPPFFMHNKKGYLYGFDVDLAQDIARRMGVELEFNRSARSFDEVVELVNRRKADVAISALSSTLGRARLVRFTDSYIVLHRALLINRIELAKQKKRYDDPLQLLNDPEMKIGVIRGTSYVGFAKEDFPKAQILHYKDWNTVVKDVLEGKIIAVLYDDIEIKIWNRANPESALYLQTVIIKNKKDPLSFAVHWKDSHLLSWLNLYLQTIKEDGTYDRLIKKYIESEYWKTE